MTLPALQTTENTREQPGLARAARLMRLLGPSAAGVWNELSAGETARLRNAMTSGIMQPTADDAARLQREISTSGPTISDAPRDVWQTLSEASPDAVAAIMAAEHPQTIALILSRMNASRAALAVRALPREIAIAALRRLLHAGQASPETLATIEEKLAGLIGSDLSGPAATGTATVARIFDGLGSELEEPILSSLDETDPGVRDRIRALMFTFDDLASLDPAAMQTILSQTDRAVLATALKGASKPVRGAFLRNMTRRAGELLVSEVEALGPIRRSRVEAARSEITAVARELAQSGDILSSDDIDDELIE
ncbi:FliG C-terminal domain-containing protein [Henriciella marina]|uniref:FliG C-terminal domain-containing protein n=1 Tax=Henriciella marina TaxID=453851 RepID=UPI00037220F0|nr:FliG C-terminal domain-containing protein [Henriciella marina]